MSSGHLIEAFLEMMSAERNAAPNTLDAYRRDLTDYAGFLLGKGKSVETAQREQVVAYLTLLEGQGLAAASAARRLSALRQFHKFLCADQIRPDDPTRIVASPRTRRPLPNVLSVAEVDRLLATAEAEANAEADLGRATGGEEAGGGADDALVVACRWGGSRLVRLDRVCAAAAAISSLAAKAGSEERSNGKACDDGDDGVG